MKRLFGITALLVAAFDCSGCMFSLGLCGPGGADHHAGATLHFEGTLTSHPNWEGTGNVCYTLNMLGEEPKHECPGFKTDRPGHFTIDRDITALRLAGGLVTSSDLYLMINGQRADSQSSDVSSADENDNGVLSSHTTIYATFALPKSALANATESHDPNAELSGPLQVLGGRASPALAPSVGQRATASAPETLGASSATVSLSGGARQ